MSRFALSVFAAFAMACVLRAETLHGIGKSADKVVDRVEVILIYDGAKSKVAIRFSDKQRFIDYDFVVTQQPTKQSALMGYFLGLGFEGRIPTVLRVDLWDGEKRFYLYSPEMACESVFIGNFQLGSTPTNKEKAR